MLGQTSVITPEEMSDFMDALTEQQGKNVDIFLCTIQQEWLNSGVTGDLNMTCSYLELINVITSAYATCDSYVIEEMDLPGRLVSGTAGNSVSQMKLSEMMNLHEAAIIRDALRRNNQNCKKTAEELGIDRSLLYRKMRKAGIAIHREIK